MKEGPPKMTEQLRGDDDNDQTGKNDDDDDQMSRMW